MSLKNFSGISCKVGPCVACTSLGSCGLHAEIIELRTDLVRLREIERLANEYKDAVDVRRKHRGVSQDEYADAAYDRIITAEGDNWREAKEAWTASYDAWTDTDESLTVAKHMAGEALFSALAQRADLRVPSPSCGAEKSEVK